MRLGQFATLDISALRFLIEYQLEKICCLDVYATLLKEEIRVVLLWILFCRESNDSDFSFFSI